MDLFHCTCNFKFKSITLYRQNTEIALAGNSPPYIYYEHFF